MDKMFTVKLAFRNLRLHRLRAALTLTGVVIGVSSIVFLLTFAFGIERLVTSEVTGGDAFRLIDVGTGDSQIITLSDDTANAVSRIGNVTGVYKLILVGATAEVSGKSMDAALYSADPGYLSASGVDAYKGANLSGSGSGGMVVNRSFADFWSSANGGGSVIGHSVSFDVVIPKGLSGKAADSQVSGQSYRVVGIVNDTSSPKVYAALSGIQALGVSQYSQFIVEAGSQGAVPAIRKQVENMGLRTQYVGDTIDQIDQIFGVFQAVLGSFGLITLIVAILGMFNTLTISLLERMKEIALMKMMGMRRRDINNVFLAESLLLGLGGGAAGLLLGLVEGAAANLALNHYALTMGGQPTSVFYAPPWFVLAVVAGAFVIGLVTGLYPARRAAKVKALDVLRYE